ncbi:MAG: hypothetical protein KAX49_08910 [Halanaerobiales bacterium]|nr:hypothetical protein [Halanaerobiales bacterium]
MGFDERKLVEMITQEVFKQLKNSDISQVIQKSPTPLVILDGRPIKSSQIELLKEALGDLKDYRIYLGGNDQLEFSGDKNLSNDFSDYLVNGKSENELDQILSESSILCLPWITLATLSRIVHLQPECMVSLLITKALLKGVPVRARKVLLKPEMNLYQLKELSPISRRVQGLIRETKLMGFEWMAKEKMKEIFKSI